MGKEPAWITKNNIDYSKTSLSEHPSEVITVSYRTPFGLPKRILLVLNPSHEGTYASVKSLLSRDYMHHVDLSETRKSPKG